MKKESFLEGALIATIAIVISKILGIIYVIPFNKAVGSLGGALYGYAYSIYVIFLDLSVAGIPFALSKLVSEENALGYKKTKEKSFKEASKMLSIIGFIMFLFLFLMAPLFAKVILGSSTGGNSIGSVTKAIRVISFSILVVPILSVYRGYFQGNNNIKTSSISQVIEQIIRVSIIIAVSILSLKIFKIEVNTVVYIALISASIGSLISLTYLFIKKERYKDDIIPNVNEKVLSSKTIRQIILAYALPFVLLNVLKSLYVSIDTFSLVRLLSGKFNYTKEEAEIVSGVISTWGFKLNMIIVSIATGVMTSLVPNISSSQARNDNNDIRNKIMQSLEVLFIIVIPMTVGLSFLTEPVWYIFYGKSGLGTSVYSVFVFTALFNVVFSTTALISQTLNRKKIVRNSFLIAFLFKLLFNLPLMYAFRSISLSPVHAAIIATILGFLMAIIYIIYMLNKTYKLDLKHLSNMLFRTTLSSLVMVACLLFIKIFVGFNLNSKLMAFMTVILYTLVGLVVYFLLIKKQGLIKKVLGEESYNKLKRKVKL